MRYLDIKKKLEIKLFRRLALACPLSPNLLTFLSVMLGLASAYLVIEGFLQYAAFLFLAAALFDALDGQVARVKHQASGFGSFFDKLADRIVDMSLLSSIILAQLVPLGPGLFTLCVIVLASYASAVAEAESMKKGLGESMSLRPVRSAVLFLGLLMSQVEAAVFLLLILGIYAFERRVLSSFRLLTKTS